MNIIQKDYPYDGHNYEGQCARCGSSVDHIRCDQCEDGFDHHDCGEDVCCCSFPENNMPCDICCGKGGWWACMSSPDWCKANPLDGREEIERGQVEWFLDERVE